MKTFANFTVLGLIGNIEKVDFESGSLLNIKIAVNNSYKKDGETITETSWLDGVVYGKKSVEYIYNNFQVGNRVLAQGNIATYNYDRTKTRKVKKTVFQIVDCIQTSVNQEKEEAL